MVISFRFLQGSKVNFVFLCKHLPRSAKLLVNAFLCTIVHHKDVKSTLKKVNDSPLHMNNVCNSSGFFFGGEGFPNNGGTTEN